MSFRPLYVQVGGEPVLALFHAAAGDVAVLICPPFGWDDVGSYRSRRDWAEQLALAGHPTLRFDLPGTSDSGGSVDVEQWTAAASEAAAWLRAETGCRRTAAIGIGAGGLVAARAAAHGAPIDDLVLWGVPARGKAFVRELRAFARIEAASIVELGGLPPPVGSPDVFAPGGFVLPAEATDALASVDVAALDLSTADRRRVLLLGRDGLSPDEELRGHFESAGAEVAVEPGEGYGAMMVEPHFAVSPIAVFERVEHWLREAIPQTAPTSDTPAPQARDAAELTVGGARIRETPIFIEQPAGRLFGIVAEPVDVDPVELCLVFLNAAAVRRIGPNRMWVDAARRWAGQGVTAVRIDLAGIGDSDGPLYDGFDELYGPGFVEQVQAVLDELASRGLPGRFAIVGLCSGGYWAFQAALRDERVVAALMLNPRALFWDPRLEAERDLRRMRSKLVSPLTVRRILRGEIEVGPQRVLAVARRALRRNGQPVDEELDDAFERLRETGTNVVFVFSGDEPLSDELEAAGRLARADRWPNITVERIPGRDHTLRPVWMQELAHAAVDRAVRREVERAARPPARVSA